MLDKKTATVLNMLADQVGYSYKVVKKQQLIGALPSKYNLTEEELVAVIGFLKDNEYLTVKYQDKDEICLALSVKAESYLSGYMSGEEQPSVKTKVAKGQAWLLVASTFIAAFLGALAAVLIGKLL